MLLITVLISLLVTVFSPAFSNSQNILRSKRSDDYIPCERGWYYFREKCYKIGGQKPSERLTWDRALAKCRSWGADLASIQSQEEQDFLNYLQYQIKFYIYIGLNDKEKELDFKWTDGSAYNYSNWNKLGNEPTGLRDESEDCVHMLFEPNIDNIGTWNDKACYSPDAYACEMKPNYRKRSPNPMFCSREEGGGWKYDSSCYHIVNEMRSWEDAERHCKIKHNGHLATIRDTLQDFFLTYILGNKTEEMWIGIKIKNQLQQKWTSGWFVSYDGFTKEENFKEGTCVARKGRKGWITVPCSNKLQFICETSNERPPVLKSAPTGSHCPQERDDWRDLGGEYCYYFERENKLNFYEANFDCKRRGGDLASIHSKEETDILTPFVKWRTLEPLIYIGLFRLLTHDRRFAWTDGSEVNYENWNPGEPNDDEEKCAAASWIAEMRWHDVGCERKNVYICSVKKILPNKEHDKTTGCAKFCVAPASYLFGVLSQSKEATRIA